MSQEEEIVEGSVARKAQALIEIPEGLNWFKPTAEKLYKLDIIPFRNKEGLMQQWVYFDVHKGLGPNKRSVICQKQFNKTCPICEAQQAVLGDCSYRDADAETQKLFKSFYPKNRVMCNVLVDGELMIFESSTFKFSDPLRRAAKSYQESEALAKFSFSSPTEGYTVTIQTAEAPNPFKPGEVFYDIESVGFRERKVQPGKDIVETTLKLDTLLHPTDNKIIEGMLYGAPDSANDSVVEETPVVSEEPKAVAQPTVEVIRQPVDVKQTVAAPVVGVKAPVVSTSVHPTVKCIGGGTFGTDYDKFKACDDCDEFAACRKKNRQIEADKVVDDDEIPF